MIERDQSQIAYDQHDFAKAANVIAKSIAHLEKTDNYGHLGISQVKQGVITAAHGDLNLGEQQIKTGLATIEKSNEIFFSSIGYFNLAKVQRQAVKVDEAKLSAQKSLELLDSINSKDEFQPRRKELEEFIAQLNR